MLGHTAESVEAYDEVMVHVVAGRVAPQATGLAYCAIAAACMEWFDIRRAQEWTVTFAAWAAQEVGMLAYRGTCLVPRFCSCAEPGPKRPLRRSGPARHWT